MIPNVTHH